MALCKGQGHYVAVVWARDTLGHTHVLTVLPNRLQATVQAFLEGIPADLKATVQRVCIDMWEGYAGAVAAALPRPHRGGSVSCRNPVPGDYGQPSETGISSAQR